MDTVTTEQLVTLYQDLLQQQASSYSTLIHTLITITAVLVGSTWLWNFLFAKKQIKSEIEDQLQDIKSEIIKKNEELISKRTKKVEEEVEKKLKRVEMDLARNFAVQCEEGDLFKAASEWWFEVLDKSIEIEVQSLIRVATMALVRVTSNEKWTKQLDEDFDFTENIEIASEIPTILDKEKKRILKALEEQSKIAKKK